jgi:hypothetical protein
MDERTWLTCDNLHQMMDYLREHNVHRRKVGRRKLKLFACACARAVWGQLNEACRSFVEGTELLADERLSQDELDARLLAVRTSPAERMRLGPASGYGILWTVVGTQYLDGMALSASSQVSMVLAEQVRAERDAAGDSAAQIGDAVRRALKDDRRRSGELAREIFGNPFRPPQKRKFPAEVRGLAQACFDDASHYPLLADALDDLGETEAAAHCRQAWHVRGCHVTDWVRGKA